MEKMEKAFNVNELRQVLSEEIRKIRDGSATASNVNAITNASGKIISTIKLQLEYCKLVGKTPDFDILLVDDAKKGIDAPVKK